MWEGNVFTGVVCPQMGWGWVLTPEPLLVIFPQAWVFTPKVGTHSQGGYSPHRGMDSHHLVGRQSPFPPGPGTQPLIHRTRETMGYGRQVGGTHPT